MYYTVHFCNVLSFLFLNGSCVWRDISDNLLLGQEFLRNHFQHLFKVIIKSIYRNFLVGKTLHLRGYARRPLN